MMNDNVIYNGKNDPFFHYCIFSPSSPSIFGHKIFPTNYFYQVVFKLAADKFVALDFLENILKELHIEEAAFSKYHPEDLDEHFPLEEFKIHFSKHIQSFHNQENFIHNLLPKHPNIRISYFNPYIDRVNSQPIITFYFNNKNTIFEKALGRAISETHRLHSAKD